MLPPERIEVGDLVVRRVTPDDAEALSEAVNQSLAHLRPWMPWATEEGATVASQRERLEGPAGGWEPESPEYSYGIFLAPGALVGGIGLHRRAGPGAFEIGYWVHVRHTGRGIATTAAGALTDAALALPGVLRTEIHCDAANRASAAVPAKLGYVLLRTENRAPLARGETGRHQIWVLTGEQWRRRGRAGRG